MIKQEITPAKSGEDDFDEECIGSELQECNPGESSLIQIIQDKTPKANKLMNLTSSGF
jgi:hypothetical protein